MGEPNYDFRPEAPELFISYASANLDRASALATRLAAEGFRVWFDKARLAPGCDWHKEIEKGCEAARIVVPLLTPIWKLSEWTRYETYGHAAVMPLIAEGAENDVLTPPLRRWQARRFDPLAADEETWRALFAAIRAKLAEPAPDRAQRLIRLLHDPCAYFTGRDADLVRIHEELHEGPVAALTQGRVRAIAALGGVGKTTLANEYARRFWRLYPQIFWVDARRGYDNEFAAIHDLLFPDRASLPITPEEKAKAALREFEGSMERLLVLDNVEDEVSCRAWIPRSGACRTLITSRFADWPQAAGVRTIHLYVLESEAARQFLLARAARQAVGDELAACDELARRLGYLPLALEVAAAYIVEQGLSFAEYLGLYEKATATLLSEHALGSDHYPDPVIATWRPTIEKFSPLARAILRLSACLAETPIQFDLFKASEPRVREFAAAFGAVAAPNNDAEAELALRAAIAKELHRYSMALDWNGKSFRVHGLVQKVEWLRANGEERRRALALAYDLITSYGPGSAFEPENFAIWDALFPHGEAAHRLGHEPASTPPSPELIERLDQYTFGRGRFEESLTYSRERLQRVEAEFGPESEEVASDLINVGEALRVLGHTVEARACFQRSVEIRRKLGAPNELATSLNYLGLSAQTYSESVTIFEEALRIIDKVADADSSTKLKLLLNLSTFLFYQGEFSKAGPVAEAALALAETSVGPKHPLTATCLANVAHLRQQQNDWGTARALLERALAIREKALGSDHPDTAHGLNNLASLLQVQGDLAGARPLCERALAIREKVFGPDHPTTAASLSNLASLLHDQGDLAGARPLHERALAIREKALGPDHPDTATSLNNLASLLQDQGDLAGARPLYERALAIWENELGPDHPNTAASLNNLAVLLKKQGDLVGARPFYERALAIHEKALGPEHPDTARSLNNLALLLKAQGDLAGARALFERALAIWEKALGPEHPDTLAAVGNLAGLLDDEREFAAAEPLHRRSLEGLIRKLGPSHPDVLSEQNNLGVSLRHAGRPDLAEPYARACADATPSVLGPTHPRSLFRRNNLVITLLMLRRAPEADALIAESWRATDQRFMIVSTGVAFLALISAGLQAKSPADPIGRLKTLLLGCALPRAEGVADKWDVLYLLDFLRDALPAGWRDFLVALLAAINDPTRAPTLDAFPLWRNTPALPLETLWPDAP
ncbi:MAG: tetratricopeptide repeat protein [Roseiarcus sp.]